MKPKYSRRYRRIQQPLKASGLFFKKESPQEQSFFGETQPSNFFNPKVLSGESKNIQRKCKECEEEEKNVQRQPEKKDEKEKLMRQVEKKEEKENIQRQAEPEKEEEKKVQMKESSPANVISANNTSSYINSLNGKGKSLPKQQQHFFGNRLSYDFSNVKIHNDTEAADSAKGVNAKAYTIGNNIIFNDAQYNFESYDGKKLLAHELVHVIQQNENNPDQLNRKIYRKIMYSIPTYKKEDPIPKILSGASSKLGETFITINGTKLMKKLDAVKAVWEAFNKNLTLRYDAATKTCRVNMENINIDISAEITLVTDPVNDKWAGQYPGRLVAGSYVCSKLPIVNIEMVVNPSGGVALKKSVGRDEAQHFADIIELSEKHIESFYNYLENLSLPSNTGTDCAAKFNVEVGNKDMIMATKFADDWLAAVAKHDNPATGTHHYKSKTYPGNCSLVKIEVNF